MSYYRRNRKQHRGVRLQPLAVVGICLLAAVILTVAVGCILRAVADEALYDRLTKGKEEGSALPVPEKTPVRSVNAYPYRLGESLDGVTPMPAASVRLNAPSGRLCYTSAVASALAMEDTPEVELTQSVLELSAMIPYISGIFTPQGLGQPTADLRHLAALGEGALLKEFLRAGGSEIVLCDIPFEAYDTDTVCRYLQALKSAMGDEPLGVAVPAALAAADNSELLERLDQICDFLLLDLRDLPLTSEELNEKGQSPEVQAHLAALAYPIRGYSMRLLIDLSHPAWKETLEAAVYPDYQIVE